MATQVREYIDLDKKGDESVFIPGFDDPLEWEAHQKEQQAKRGGCCAGPQPIQGEEMNEQNLEKFYTEEGQDNSEDEQEEAVKQIEIAPQKKESQRIVVKQSPPRLSSSRNDKFDTFAGNPEFNKSQDHTPVKKLQDPEVIHKQVEDIQNQDGQLQVSQDGMTYDNLSNSHFDRRDQMDQASAQKSGYGRIGGAHIGHNRRSYRNYAHPGARDEQFCNLI